LPLNTGLSARKAIWCRSTDFGRRSAIPANRLAAPCLEVTGTMGE
jgi:hypothetical protein